MIKPYTLLLFLSTFTSPLLSDSSPNESLPTIVFGCPTYQNSSVSAALLDLYEPSFKQLGYKFELRHYPILRVASELLNGNIDGICAISKVAYSKIKSEQSTMLSVNVGVASIRYFTTDPTIINIQLIDLSSSNLKIGYVTGGISETLVNKSKTTTHSIANTELAVKMLIAKRLDVLIALDVLANGAIDNLGSKVKIHQGKPLKTVNYYPLLNNQHKNISYKLNTILTDSIAQKNGTKHYNSLFPTHLQPD